MEYRRFKHKNEKGWDVMKNCEGCYTKSDNSLMSFYNDYPCYHIRNEKYQKKCPCKICIVKVTCYKPCEEYTEHWKSLPKLVFRMGNSRGK